MSQLSSHNSNSFQSPDYEMSSPENSMDETASQLSFESSGELTDHAIEPPRVLENMNLEEIIRNDDEASPEEQTVEINMHNDERREKGSKGKKEKPAKQQSQGGETEHTATYKKFLEELEKEKTAEAKLQLAIQFMSSALSQQGTPDFKSFWDIRKLCLNLFKENINPTLRSEYWTKYSELSKEARSLKEILDEQSAFAIEQIEIAISALEQEILHFDEIVEKMSDLRFPYNSIALEANNSFYNTIQKKLNVLNAQASRINVLRKELIKTEMRIRHKNKFFQRLSQAGDKVFPRRKEYIKDVSQKFMEDVDRFIDEHFGDKNRESIYILRDEIKALQAMAKVFTLNTHSFGQTRTKLSECWDKIKLLEKDRKKAIAQQRQAFKQNAETALHMIEEFNKGFQSGGISLGQADNKIEEIVRFMRKSDLGREELKVIREELNKSKAAVLEKQTAEDAIRQQEEQERTRAKREALQALKSEIESLLGNVDQHDADALAAMREEMVGKIQSASLSKIEKQELERLLKPLKDIISDKKERALLSLSEDDRQSLHQLKEIYSQRKQRRQEIKNQLESLRKLAGSSGMDFEMAMKYNVQINEEKERLDKINMGVKEIEQKISELQGKV